jgi:hypothetical protein
MGVGKLEQGKGCQDELQTYIDLFGSIAGYRLPMLWYGDTGSGRGLRLDSDF